MPGPAWGQRTNDDEYLAFVTMYSMQTKENIVKDDKDCGAPLDKIRFFLMTNWRMQQVNKTQWK